MALSRQRLIDLAIEMFHDDFKIPKTNREKRICHLLFPRTFTFDGKRIPRAANNTAATGAAAGEAMDVETGADVGPLPQDALVQQMGELGIGGAGNRTTLASSGNQYLGIPGMEAASTLNGQVGHP